LSFVTGGGKFESALLHVRDEKANGTHGGTNSSGSFLTRTLNTVKTNEISGASLSSNQIILPSGTYYIQGRSISYRTDETKTKLRNITDSSDAVISTSTRAGYDAVTTCDNWIIGRFTITAQKTFELQQRSNNYVAGDGYGTASNFSTVEVYSDVQIWKVA